MNALKLLKIEQFVCLLLIFLNVVMLALGLASGVMSSIIAPLIGIIILVVLYVILWQQASKLKRTQRENENKQPRH